MPRSPVMGVRFGRMVVVADRVAPVSDAKPLAEAVLRSSRFADRLCDRLFYPL